jgi:hypothetical protein
MWQGVVGGGVELLHGRDRLGEEKYSLNSEMHTVKQFLIKPRTRKK